jgi:hypothetical protein
LAAAVFCLVRFSTVSGQPRFGVTFGSLYASQLGLDPKAAYLAIIDDLGVKKIRLPVFWSQLERQKDEFDWSPLDFFINEAEVHDVALTLVVGRKVPRWPECYVPDWAKSLPDDEAEAVVLQMVQAVVERYKDSPAVAAWQVENEPFFFFGLCPSPSLDLLKKEIALVKSLDARPIILTVSGEMDSWLFSARLSDVLGISMYRVSYNPVAGLLPYPLTPLVYRFRALLTGFFSDKIIISELQAEPWFVKPISQLTAEERAVAFTPEDLFNNVDFARRAGFSEVYLWGVEWWLAEKEAGRPELWEAAKFLFK